jgi:hypothetical protein
VVAMAAAQAQAAERRLIDAFRVAGATAPDRARAPEELRVVPDAAFGHLVEAGLLRERARGAFYLDEAAVIARRDHRPKRVRPALVLTIAALAALGFVLLALLLSRAT